MPSAYSPCQRTATFLIAFLLTVVSVPRTSAADWKFRVEFAEAVHRGPFTGRAYIFFSRTRSEPRHDPSWFRPESFVALDVADWKPGEPLEFSSLRADVLSYPKPMTSLDLAGLKAQAVVRFDPVDRKLGDAPGNGYSQVLAVGAPGDSTLPPFVVDRVVASKPFPESESCKEFVVRSKRLSDFYGRPTEMKAAVHLPASYASDTKRRYPTIFTVPGFGSTHYPRQPIRRDVEQNREGVEFLRVVLAPGCPLGHHVFADSENNGPVGQALIHEFLPAFDGRFRSVADPKARFLTGHSSGGWSSLWLQTTYPEQFGGTWSTSPDPVDFRDFQGVDIYRAGQNVYVDSRGAERPLARMGSRPVLYFRGFSKMEQVLGPGGQLGSFEAVFSPRGADGKPRPLWDRQTGAVDPAVAKAWEAYDIRLRLERNWKTLGPKLAGKIHVFTGDNDTFYLEGAVRLLKASLQKLGSDAVIEIHAGKDHFSLLDEKLSRRIRGEMVDVYLKSFGDSAKASSHDVPHHARSGGS